MLSPSPPSAASCRKCSVSATCCSAINSALNSSGISNVARFCASFWGVLCSSRSCANDFCGCSVSASTSSIKSSCVKSVTGSAATGSSAVSTMTASRASSGLMVLLVPFLSRWLRVLLHDHRIHNRCRNSFGELDLWCRGCCFLRCNFSG
jgi:hypothetical protein